MDCALEGYLKIGLVHAMAFPQVMAPGGPWVETVTQIARDPFFSGIELTSIPDDAVRAQVKAICRDAGLSVGFAAQPVALGGGLDLNSLDEEARQKALTRLKQAIEEACSYPAETFCVLSGKDPGPAERNRALDLLVQSLGELCQYAKDCGGPPVILEVFDHEVDKCCLVGPADLSREVAQRVRAEHDNFGLMVDLSHLPLIKETPRQALEPVKDYLAAIHLGDAIMDPDQPGYGDNHPTFGMPGGVNQVPEMLEFLRVLKDIGYLNKANKPWVSFEVKPMEGQDSLVVLANAKRVLQRAWALL